MATLQLSSAGQGILRSSGSSCNCVDPDTPTALPKVVQRCCNLQDHLSSHQSVIPNLCAADVKESVRQTIEAHADSIDEISLKIHGCPELAYEEVQAHAVLTEYIKQQGFEVEESWLGLRTAFRAQWGNGHPVISICAEYDALPEIGHACGHNLISSAAISAAIGIKSFLENSPGINGTIQLLGTPAEESSGGKVEIINRGGFEGVDAALMVHPAPVDILYPAMLAIERISIEFHGKNAHAAANPFDGVNALDAIIQCFNNIGMARQQMKSTWRVHGIITHGGVKANIIPDYTRAELFLRAPQASEVKELKAKVVACAEGAATATGCTANVAPLVNANGVKDLPYSDMVTNEVLAELYRKNAASFNKRFHPRQVESRIPTGSSDMGNVSYVVPAIHPMFRIQTNHGNHHPGFTERAKTKSALNEARIAGCILAYCAVDAFSNPSILAEARNVFHKP